MCFTAPLNVQKRVSGPVSRHISFSECMLTFIELNLGGGDSSCQNKTADLYHKRWMLFLRASKTCLEGEKKKINPVIGAAI